MSRHRYVVCDVFTDTPLVGNQLAVFTDARGLDQVTMQALAREINFSETVFVLPPERGGTARIRIFDPKVEMRFAGHPTLGTAFVLGAPLQLGVIVLETLAGNVPVTLERDESGRIVRGTMSQPIPQVTDVPDHDALLAALGVERAVLPVEQYDNGAVHWLVALESPAEVEALAPDYRALAIYDVTGINCFAGSETRWKTRMFMPTLGIEDPATGSAAGPIACHLARHGVVDWGTELELTQGVEIGRPSTLYARAEGGSGLIDAVEVGGSAVTVARGEFSL